VGGAFHASELFDHDPHATAAEIQSCGADALAWAIELADELNPPPIDVHLIRSFHRRWFATTFPADCGRERLVIVANRKGTAVPPAAILPAVYNACDNWAYRFEEVVMAASGEDQIELLVSEANALAVRVYDIHPFLDGNTRTTYLLRNYALMLGGVGPVLNLHDDQAHIDAWMAATPLEHRALDDIVLEALFDQSI
jgi:Fic family protein